MWSIIPHVRVRTCDADDVFTRVGDTCELFDSVVARVCVCYSGVSHVCVYTMLDSMTLTVFFLVMMMTPMLKIKLIFMNLK